MEKEIKTEDTVNETVIQTDIEQTETESTQTVITETKAENELTQADIKTLMLNSKSIRYCIKSDTYYICVDDLFAILFDKGRAKYHQINKLKENFSGLYLHSKTSSNIDSFFAEYDIHTALYEYRIQKSTYDRNPENYESYCRFMQQGGMNQIAAALGLEQVYPYKDLSEIGYMPLADTVKQPEVEPQAHQQVQADTVAVEDTETQSVSNSTENEGIKADTGLDIILDAIEQIKSTSDDNFQALAKNDAHLLVLINAVKEDNRKKVEQLGQQQSALEKQLQKPTITQSTTSDALRERFTNERIWLRIAICVTLIFLPFTFLGLHKYIAIETSNWLSSFFVGLLCFAIAAVWDGAIFLFTINGKKELAAFGSFVQFVFMSAKFDFIAKSCIDFGLDGYYWQEKAVILCAVIYSPLLLNQISDLAMKGLSGKNQKSN